MGDASKSESGAGLRLADWAFALLGVALVWPVLAIIFLGGDAAWPRAFWLDGAPSLVLIAGAALLFFKAARR